MEELEGRLNHIMEFQLSDSEKALELATANFLATQGAVVCTEFLGGIASGTLGVRGEGYTAVPPLRLCRSNTVTAFPFETPPTAL